MYRPSDSELRRIVRDALEDACTAGESRAEGREAAVHAVQEAHGWQISATQAEAIVRRMTAAETDLDCGTEPDDDA